MSPEVPCLKHLAGKPNGRHEAIVEGTHVLDAGSGYALQDLVAFVRRASERLLADDVLARFRGRDRRLGVEVVRSQSCRKARPGRRRRSRASRSTYASKP